MENNRLIKVQQGATWSFLDQKSQQWHGRQWRSKNFNQSKISLDSFGEGSGIFLFREGYPQFPFFLSGFYSLILGVPHNFQEPIPQSWSPLPIWIFQEFFAGSCSVPSCRTDRWFHSEWHAKAHYQEQGMCNYFLSRIHNISRTNSTDCRAFVLTIHLGRSLPLIQNPHLPGKSC